MTALAAHRVGIDIRRYAWAPLLIAMLARGSSVPNPMIDAWVAMLAAATLCGCCADPAVPDLSSWGRISAALLFLATALVAVQLVPAPFGWWFLAPGRATHASDLALIGDHPAYLPPSLAPAETLHSVLRLLPAVALFVSAGKTDRHALRSAAWLVCIVAGVLGVLIIIDAGAHRVGLMTSADRLSWFPNANHGGDYLLMAAPICLALSLRRTDSEQGVTWAQAVAAGLGLLCLAGVLISGSIAVIALSAPVVLLSVITLLPGRWRWLMMIVTLTVAVAAGAVIAVLEPAILSPIFASIGDGPLGRETIWRRTVEAIGVYWPLGSGGGTFAYVYPGFEDPAEVTNVFVNRAHNDYLEVALETGLPGLMLAAVAVLVVLWRAAAALMRVGTPGGRLRAAAAIALLVPIFHSLIDYPLRTQAVVGLAVLCVALLTVTNRAGRSQPG